MCESDLAFVVSQSGCSNSIDALDKLKSMGHLAVGLTGVDKFVITNYH